MISQKPSILFWKYRMRSKEKMITQELESNATFVRNLGTFLSTAHNLIALKEIARKCYLPKRLPQALSKEVLTLKPKRR